MIEICLTNLGKYNEGELIYSRLVLPATTEAYGRDMDHNGHFAETDSGYIEIFN